jgi:hypothetical protein
VIRLNASRCENPEFVCNPECSAIGSAAARLITLLEPLAAGDTGCAGLYN